MYVRTDRPAVLVAEADSTLGKLNARLWTAKSSGNRRRLARITEKACARYGRRFRALELYDFSQLNIALAFEHNHERN